MYCMTPTIVIVSNSQRKMILQDIDYKAASFDHYYFEEENQLANLEISHSNISK